MTNPETAIRITLEDIEWELEQDDSPRIVAELEEERDELVQRLLTR